SMALPPIAFSPALAAGTVPRRLERMDQPLDHAVHRLECGLRILELEARVLRAAAQGDRPGIEDLALARPRVARPGRRDALVRQRPAGHLGKAHRRPDRLFERALEAVAAVDQPPPAR